MMVVIREHSNFELLADNAKNTNVIYLLLSDNRYTVAQEYVVSLVFAVVCPFVSLLRLFILL